jgi:5-oxoprolinase (ATP-hydrolysing)
MAMTGVDRGGTFTDVVVVDGGSARIRKVPSDAAVSGDLAVGELRFGTTVATNALLEGRGLPALLVVTRGFADLPFLGDMTRPSLFDPWAEDPPLPVARVLEVDGRIGPGGDEIEPLALPASVDLAGIGAIAVALLHGPANPAHERAVAAFLAARAPGVPIVCGHAVDPAMGYLARVHTAWVEAAVTPVLRAALRRDRVPDDALAMRSDGGLVPAAALGASSAVLSGPAGGAVAVRAVARALGRPVVGFDMGGTSTDVCVVRPDEDLPLRWDGVRVGGVRLRTPSVWVDTIAAGGGSVVSAADGFVRVGPSSAGAHPGPQCYGRGGPPTLTDAALLDGRLDPGAFDPPLRADAVSLPAAPAAALAVAHETMAAAVRRLLLERGVDPAEAVLLPYGGAGPQHAAALAERLRVASVLIPPWSSVGCAWGMVLASRAERAWRSGCWDLDDPALASVADALAAGLPRWPERVKRVVVRHVGSDGEIAVPAGPGAAAAFRAAHARRFGFARSLPLEAVGVSVEVRQPPPPPPALPPDAFGLGARTVAGPARLDHPTTSVVVPAGWEARADVHGTWLTRRGGAAPPADGEASLAVWASRFGAVAAEAGLLLERTARSVSIRERRDFSCALFDGDGHLLANAPHVPVHLGAMGETVRDLLRAVPDPEPGQHWLTNDPRAGGSHLPDLTVICAVSVGGRRMFVGSRAHHVDVGGSTPGSMPPRAATLAEEGFVVRHLPLLVAGRVRPDLVAHLVGCRQPATVVADLEAQIAANGSMAAGLAALGPGDAVARWGAALADAAEAAVRDVVAAIPDGARAEEVLDGIPLAVTLRRAGDGLVVDFAGTGGPHPGNLNAPRAVVRAAVLYALRVLAGRDLPLNEGALRPVTLAAPAGSILDPPDGSAVAGGNVETSQRVVDLILAAAGVMAPSAGTMSNLTLGGDGWAYYETLGAGQGGSPRGRGASARQLHLTNTRATDPEVLEARLPLRVRAFERRRGSGGAGRWPGGDGLIREIEVLAPATAALLATRRDRGAPGLAGGSAGAPGADAVRRADGPWTPWDGSAVALAPGDRVRVETPGGGGFGAPC